MKTKIKICGIKTLEDALFCETAGADYLGFNFVRVSSRYINPGKAKSIIERLIGKVGIVGVFRDEPPEKVLETVKDLSLDLIQLHGNEDENYCNSFANLRIIKVTVLSGPDQINAEKFPAEFLMIDREVQGEGKPVEFYKAAGLSRIRPLFLAGGLTCGNVRRAISIVKPYAVDVASGVETNGRKDLEKIQKFINEVKSVS